MRAELQRIYEPAFCLRLWHDPSHGYGDPYQWAATARLIDDDSLEIMGVTQPPTREMMRAILRAAADLGYLRVGTRRIKPDRTFMRWHPTRYGACR
jgi:hypothetical protein